jgi:hypothetical protein
MNRGRRIPGQHRDVNRDFRGTQADRRTNGWRRADDGVYLAAKRRHPLAKAPASQGGSLGCVKKRTVALMADGDFQSDLFSNKKQQTFF